MYLLEGEGHKGNGIGAKLGPDLCRGIKQSLNSNLHEKKVVFALSNCLDFLLLKGSQVSVLNIDLQSKPGTLLSVFPSPEKNHVPLEVRVLYSGQRTLELRAQMNGVSSKFSLSFLKKLSSTCVWHRMPEPPLSAVQLISSYSVSLDSFNQCNLAFLPERFMGMTLDILDYERYRRIKTQSTQVI